MLTNLKINLKNHWLSITVIGYVAIAWSWLLFIKVAMISNNTLLATIFAVVIYGLIVLVSSVIFIKFIRYLLNFKKPGYTTLLRIIFLWAFAEWFVAWSVALVWLGKNGSIDSVFPFGSFTPFLMYTPLGYLGRFLGYHGISAVFVILIFVTFIKQYKRFRIAVYLSVIVLTVVSWAAFKQPNGGSSVITFVAQYLGQPMRVDASHSDLTVLPEYGLDGITDKNLNEIFINNPSAFVSSKQEPAQSGQVKNIFIYGNKRGFISQVNKTRLVPGGEYLPYSLELALRAVGKRSEIKAFEYRRGVVKGASYPTPIKVKDNLVVGSAVCSSIISTEDYRRLSSEGATILTNSASLGIFGGSRIFNWQHRGLAKFMATANARPFIQSSSGGDAFAINQNGGVIQHISPINAATIRVTTNQRRTPYTYLGEWLSIIGGAVSVITIIKLSFRKFTNRKKSSNK